jgi:hypothetical protein
MSSDLQFERAEYEHAAAAAMACSECRRTLTNSYFQAGGRIVCEACAYTLQAQGGGGSAIGRASRAFGAGLIAAILGSLLYYAIGALTGYEFALVAIVVGFAVGGAVRWGSRARGGWAYQALAMGLTYLAIVSTYIPAVIGGFNDVSVEQTVAASSDQSDDSADAAEETDASVATEPAADGSITPVAETSSEPTVRKLTIAESAVVFGTLLLIACAAPFLAGFENIIGLIIIGIGLYEAWKLNRKEAFEITGPHPVAAAGATGA